MDLENFFEMYYKTPSPTEEFMTAAQNFYDEIINNNNDEYKAEVCKKIYGLINRKNVNMTIFLYSMLVKLDYNTEIMEEFIDVGVKRISKSVDLPDNGTLKISHNHILRSMDIRDSFRKAVIHFTPPIPDSGHSAPDSSDK